MAENKTFHYSNSVLYLDEDMPSYGHVMFFIFAIIMVSLLHHMHFHADASFLVKLIGWLILLPIILWLFYLALKRRQVSIDLLQNNVHIRAGFVYFMNHTSYPLSGFNEFKVTTERTPSVDIGSPAGRSKPDKITKKFYLVGSEQLHIATRCYSANDRKRENMIWKFEVELKQKLKPKGIS